MYISDLKLVNFRNYIDERVVLDKGTNILLGANAQGKTNFLEAVYYCSKGQSFKTNSDKTIVRRGEELFSLDAQIIRTNRHKLIHIEGGQDKNIFINGLRLEKLEELKNQFEIVYFLPDHLRIVKDGPGLRRELVDEAIENIRPSFKGLLLSYDQVLKSRNKKLKVRSKYFKEEMAAMTAQLVGLGAKITRMRKAYIDSMKERAYLIHKDLSSGREDLELGYKSIVKDFTDERGVGLSLKEAFEESLERDLDKGYTTKGPHRDDIEISLNGLDIKEYGSQGQQRSAILSIKLAEIDLIKENSGFSPILLLDDVFSELDEDRQEKLLEKTRGIQSLISTNTLDISPKDAKIYRVKEGKLYP